MGFQKCHLLARALQQTDEKRWQFIIAGQKKLVSALLGFKSDHRHRHIHVHVYNYKLDGFLKVSSSCNSTTTN